MGQAPMRSAAAHVAPAPARTLGTWPHSLPHDASLRVSDVLALVQREFPAMTTSKLRFLDAQGLVRPQRTNAGYRQYSPADVERLRFVLRQQRDHYRPLTVIRQLLEDLDAGLTHEPVLPHEVVDEPESLHASQLAQRSGVAVEFVQSMEDNGLLEGTSPGQYDPDCVHVVAAAWAYVAAGADIREVRALMLAADRLHDSHRRHQAASRAKGHDESANVRERELGEASIAVMTAFLRRHYDH